jgi:hypothetical protein
MGSGSTRPANADTVRVARPSGVTESEFADAWPPPACRPRLPPNASPDWVILQIAGRLVGDLAKLGRYPVLIVDEVGNILVDPPSRQRHVRPGFIGLRARPMIVSSDKAVAWREMSGDEIVAVAIIDGLIHYADIPSRQFASAH